MTNEKAIQWLTMQKEKPVRWDDYSEESRAIREAAEMQMKQAFDMAIYALKAQEEVEVKIEQDTYPDETPKGFALYYCGNCGDDIADGQKFCANCGRPVKWE